MLSLSVLDSSISGYVSARLYSALENSQNWKLVTLGSSFHFPLDDLHAVHRAQSVCVGLEIVCCRAVHYAGAAFVHVVWISRAAGVCGRVRGIQDEVV